MPCVCHCVTNMANSNASDAEIRVPTTLQNSFSLTFPDKMKNFPTNFFIRDNGKTTPST